MLHLNSSTLCGGIEVEICRGSLRGRGPGRYLGVIRFSTGVYFIFIPSPSCSLIVITVLLVPQAGALVLRPTFVI
jgi:hypothetical protein